MSDKRLRTIAKASKEIGVSQSFLHKLTGKGKLSKHKIPGHSAIYISLEEFERLATPLKIESL